MKKEEILERLLSSKVIAVIRLTDAEKVMRVAEVLQAGGIRAIEITMTVPGAAGVIRDISLMKPPDILVGAGTVMDAGRATEVINAGADFVVSPIMDKGMIDACRAAGVLVAPGAFTPTEIVNAWRAGADIVKVFPATSLGPQFFRDLRGPLPEIRLMPTGGVTIENAGDFLKAGAVCVGIGTALVDQRTVEAGDWEAIADRARRLARSIS